MRKNGILNAELVRVISKIGHTQFLVIADAGLPLPKGVPVIDLSLVRGIPKFEDVINAIEKEMVIESFVIAEELPANNHEIYEKVKEKFGKVKETRISHEKFKKLTKEAEVIIRTGEVTSYSNVVLVAGVNF